MLQEYVFQPVLLIQLSPITMLPIVALHNVWQFALECILLILQLLLVSTHNVPVFPRFLRSIIRVLVRALLHITRILSVENVKLLVVVHI